jgi:protein-tyrosine phosphatase
LCGKHFVGPDPATALSACAADRLVCLCERDELADRYPEYVAWLVAQEGIGAWWCPVPDLHAPSLEEAELLLDRLDRLIRSGHGVLMHCGAGIGRAGTMAAALLVEMGVPVSAALSTVATARPMAGPEAGVQSELLERLAAIQDRAAG